MTRIALSLALVIALILPTAGAALAQNQTPATQFLPRTKSIPQGGDIVIGGLLSLTGNWSSLGLAS